MKRSADSYAFASSEAITVRLSASYYTTCTAFVVVVSKVYIRGFTISVVIIIPVARTMDSESHGPTPSIERFMNKLHAN